MGHINIYMLLNLVFLILFIILYLLVKLLARFAYTNVCVNRFIYTDARFGAFNSMLTLKCVDPILAIFIVIFISKKVTLLARE